MAFFSDTPGRFAREPRYSQQQQGGFDLLRQLGMEGLQKGPADFQPIEDFARYQHRTKTQPSIAERFTATGGRHSSAFNEAQQKAGERLDLGLAGLRSQHGMQQQGQLMQMLMGGLQPQDEINYIPGQPSTAAQLGAPLMQGVGAYAPMALASMFNNQDGDNMQLGGQAGDQAGGWKQALAAILGGTAGGAATGGPAGAGVGGGLAALSQLLQYFANRNSGQQQQQSGSVSL